MSKFNAKKSNQITNYMGSKAFKHNSEIDLVMAVLTTFLEDKYYESKDDRIKRIKDLIQKCDDVFIAKLALVTRRDFHLRSVFHLLVAELSRKHRGDNLISKLMEKSIERPDDITEIVSILGKPLPKQIRLGIKKSLKKFNSYSLAKYQSKNKKFSLKDILKMVRPNPKDYTEEQAIAFKQIIKDELKNTETWEARLSSGEDKEQVWEDLVINNKIGYMALLRNLRNLVKQANQNTIEKAVESISDPIRVLKSKQLPYRFLSAYLALDQHDNTGLRFEKDNDSDLLKQALEKAVTYSIDNLPLLEGKTLILSDNSGSMRGDSGNFSFLSSKSKRLTSDIGNLFALLYWYRCDNTLIGLFGDRLITVNDLDRKKGVLENFKIVDEFGKKCGPSTETGIFHMFEKLIEEKVIIDRIVIFSDCQIGTGCNWYDTTHTKKGDDFNKLFQKYKIINPNVKVYTIDLQGYGNTVIANGVIKISGWSDKIFSMMEFAEKENQLVDFIKEVNL